MEPLARARTHARGSRKRILVFACAHMSQYHKTAVRYRCNASAFLTFELIIFRIVSISSCVYFMVCLGVLARSETELALLFAFSVCAILYYTPLLY